MVFGEGAAGLAVVHVHGSLGNFYQQPFIRIFANRLARHGVALLSFNLTSHDGIAEGYSIDGDMEYVGGSLSDFGTCVDDIDAMVTVARSFCPRVVLQGHSLGCDRVLHYAREREELPLILLSPCDSYRLQEVWLGGEDVESQVRRLAAASGHREDAVLLPAEEYGVKGPDGWTYSIPICRSALLSVLTGSPCKLLRIGHSTEVISSASALVYLGTEDAIRAASIEKMKDHVRAILPRAQVVTASGDHGLVGCEDDMAVTVLRWAGSVGLLDAARMK